MAIYAIIPSRTAIIAAITPVPVVINVLLGHNGFLTSGLIGLALVLLERRPWLSGIFLGLLTYKPQFGILFPLALLASRNWRVVMGAIATSAIFALVAAIAFGHQTWPLFIDALLERASNLNEDPTLNSPLISTFGFLRARGVDVHMAWTAQLALATIVAAIVCAFWVKPFSYPLKAAALAIGSVLVAPHVISYDLCILSIAAAFLVKDGLSYGFLPGERAIMFFCWVGLILSCDISFDIFPASICAVLLVIVAGRALACGERVLKGSRALLKA